MPANSAFRPPPKQWPVRLRAVRQIEAKDVAEPLAIPTIVRPAFGWLAEFSMIPWRSGRIIGDREAFELAQVIGTAISFPFGPSLLLGGQRPKGALEVYDISHGY